MSCEVLFPCASYLQIWQSGKSPHTNPSPGKNSKTTRRRKRRRKRRKPPPPPPLLLTHRQIHQLLIRSRTNGAVSQPLARRRRARRAKSLSLSLCQNRSPNLCQSLNRNLHLQPPRPQQTTCGDFPRPARRKRARRARSVKSLLFKYLTSRVARIDVLTARWCDYPGRAQSKRARLGG